MTLPKANLGGVYAVRSFPRLFPRSLNSQRLLPLIFLSPAVLWVILVTFGPVLEAVNLSLHRTNFLELGRFVGFANYVDFLKAPLSRTNLENSLVFTFGSLTLSLPLAVGLALLLEHPFPGRGVFQTLLILPWVVSQLLTALLWRFISSPLIGPLSYFLGVLTDSRVDIFGTASTALFGVIITNVWRTFPYAMILTLAALQTIPRELYEAGRMDGATGWRLFWHVKFPLIRNTLLVATIMMSIHYFNMIELPLILTGGGPAGATDLLGLRVYREAFILLKFGSASAIAIIMFLVNVVFSLIYIRVLRSERYY